MTNQLTHYDGCFLTDEFPMSLDEVLGERELALVFNYAPYDPSVGLYGGLDVFALARVTGDAEWEDITHLLSAKEYNSCLRDVEIYLQLEAEVAL